MSRDTSAGIRSFLDRHWATPGEVITAADELWSPMGPDPDLFSALAELLAAVATDVEKELVAAEPLAALTAALGALCHGLGDGTIDPLGPAGGLLEPAATALEDAFVSLEAGLELDPAALERPTESIVKAAGISLPSLSAGQPQPAPAPPATPLSPAAPATPALSAASATSATPAASAATYRIESWGPWEPAYPDLEDDFLEEIQGCIDNLQSGLISLSGGSSEAELVNELFRASHSIKGQSGQMGARPLERVAHKMEDVLDLVRQGTLTLEAESTAALLGVIDALQSILDQLRETRTVEHSIEAEIALMERVVRGESPVRPQPTTVATPQPPAGAKPEEPPAKAPSSQPAEPAAREQAPRPSEPNQPPNTAPKSGKPGGATRAKSQFLRVDFAKVDQVMNLIGDLFINKIKLHDGLATLDELHLQAMRLQSLITQRQESVGEAGGSLVLDADDSRRLLGNIAKLASDLEELSDRLSTATGETDMISSDLRDQVMVMRMVPLDSVFGRLGRVVFDAIQKESRGHEQGYKEAKLEIEGADAEIDKVIANVLEVPLVHIVRNAVAHGIEPAEERITAGKPPSGRVHVTAGQRGNQFVITVEDDGRGMVPDVIGQVALDKGIIDTEELDTLSEKEILGLIFKPGFTTAEKADDLKGRGVGLDEVMSKINQVKGNIEVESEVGQGSKVTLSLPLTLAINTVIIGEVSGDTLAIPMSVVERVVKVREQEIEHLGDAEVFTLLEQTVPLVRTDELLGMGRPPSHRPDAFYVVVINVGDRRFGLALDRMQGKQDVVVKSLGTLVVEAPLVAGATLLGERCILILDPVDIAANLGKGKIAGTRRAQPRVERLKPRLLLVEDDATTRIRLRRIFEDAGLDVFEAGDGVEALEAAASQQFQMVSTDVVMPRMDGYELTRKLRELPQYQDTPILMISGKSEGVDRRVGFEAGVDYYLVKPVERAELFELIEEVRL